MPRRPLRLPFSGPRLTEVRERAGHGIGELAELLTDHGHKVFRTTVGKWENGEHKPSPAALKALAAVLDVEIDDLLEPTEDAA